ncbi:MAG: hypothetical protein ACI9PZ_002055 [Parvicella sp.]
MPNLRTPKDECYADVKQVLSGNSNSNSNSNRIKRLKLKAGDLQFFKGRLSLHQVTPNAGETDSLLLIMSFTEKPGVIGSVTRVKDLYGKITQVHLDHEANRVRSDTLID